MRSYGILEEYGDYKVFLYCLFNRAVTHLTQMTQVIAQCCRLTGERALFNTLRLAETGSTAGPTLSDYGIACRKIAPNRMSCRKQARS